MGLTALPRALGTALAVLALAWPAAPRARLRAGRIAAGRRARGLRAEVPKRWQGEVAQAAQTETRAQSPYPYY
jgi:hypothetical protein